MCCISFTYLNMSYYPSVSLTLSLQSNVYWPNIHSINLTLFNISRDDNNFQLTCIAENVVGMTNFSIQLNVQCELGFIYLYIYFFKP